MVFVTVGTHEQQFDRLVRAADAYAASTGEEVFVQTGYSACEPSRCVWARFVPYAEMRSRMEAADVVVTHGGPSSFVEAMAAGKVPVVVPRLARFGEHVNDHQGGIVPVYDVADLAGAIGEARRLSRSGAGFRSHNAEFCQGLLERIERL